MAADGRWFYSMENVTWIHGGPRPVMDFRSMCENIAVNSAMLSNEEHSPSSFKPLGLLLLLTGPGRTAFPGHNASFKPGPGTVTWSSSLMPKNKPLVGDPL